MTITLLPPIKETTEDYEALEKTIREFFRKRIYLPLIRDFDETGAALKNAKPQGLLDALRSGRVTFSRGTFSGRFSAQISKDLRALGAVFHRSEGTYKAPFRDLPREVRNQISASDSKYEEKIAKIDERLSQIQPEEFASQLKVEHHFDRALWKVQKKFEDSVQGITIAPKLSDEQRRRIAAEWSDNMQLWIKDFTEKEIKELRANMQKTILSGDRYGSAVKTIQDSYGVTERKAKFLARQETSLLMTKFKQTRYQEAGVDYYRWDCVTGTKAHPVRPMHLKNKGKVWRWDDPPVVDDKGNHKNPGQDYNCRCTARPLVGYKGPTGVPSPR